ncbi:MAG: hypothetical protein IPP77_11935 [Bacteroidetes bacterium]|nr:hypothetical protein [Bacteroidota bacterium]
MINGKARQKRISNGYGVEIIADAFWLNALQKQYLEGIINPTVYLQLKCSCESPDLEVIWI